jgi:hypothetical protein
MIGDHTQGPGFIKGVTIGDALQADMSSNGPMSQWIAEMGRWLVALPHCLRYWGDHRTQMLASGLSI